MTTSQIVKSNNKALEQRLLKSIKELPNHTIKSTCVHDTAFDEPIKSESYQIEKLIK